jgi:sortase B
MKKPINRRRLRCIAMVFFLLVFLISGGMLLRNLLRDRTEQAANQALSQQVRAARAQVRQTLTVSPAPSDADSDDTAAESDADSQETAVDPADAAAEQDTVMAETDAADPDDPVLAVYAQLHQENPDLAGWLYIEGTDLDYPVLYTPDDPEYYLRRAFDGSYAYSGSLFVGAGCTPDGTNVIIYGHHMNSGTMFGELLNYKNVSYFNEHPTIHYDTLDELGEYEVLSVFYARVYTSADTDVFRYYQYTDLSDESRFNEFVSQAKAASIYDTGVDAQYGDRLLTLSTCSYHTTNGRFVVVAKRKDDA